MSALFAVLQKIWLRRILFDFASKQILWINPSRHVSSLTVEKLLAAISKVLQSKDEIRLDSGFQLDVITVHQAVGAGRKIVNISANRIRKKCISVIPPDNEGLCCAKAIVFALAHLNGDRMAINAMRDLRRPNLINRARSLHEEAGVPAGPCTAVFSSENLKKVYFILNCSVNMCVFSYPKF